MLPSNDENKWRLFRLLWGEVSVDMVPWQWSFLLVFITTMWHFLLEQIMSFNCYTDPRLACPIIMKGIKSMAGWFLSWVIAVLSFLFFFFLPFFDCSLLVILYAHIPKGGKHCIYQLLNMSPIFSIMRSSAHFSLTTKLRVEVKESDPPKSLQEIKGQMGFYSKSESFSL